MCPPSIFAAHRAVSCLHASRIALSAWLLVSLGFLSMPVGAADQLRPVDLAETEALPEPGAFLRSPGKILFLGDSITHAGDYITMLETHFRQDAPSRPALQWINLGLPSETCTGLSEPGHPFPRPNVHERLDRALEKVKPDVVVACYGMNDGIYHPFDEARFQAYQQGIATLVEKAKASGAYVILLTPPPFDPQPMRLEGKLVPAEAEAFAWHSVFENYDEVIARYAAWILEQRDQVHQVIDIHTPLVSALEALRREDGSVAFSGDGVHLDAAGHRLIAAAVLRAWGREPQPLDPDLYAQVERRQRLMHAAWLTHVGHQRPGMEDGPPLETAMVQAQIMDAVLGSLEANLPRKARLTRLTQSLDTLRADVWETRRRLGDRFLKHYFPDSEAPVSLHDGVSLHGWKGDSDYWSVEPDGTLRAANDDPVASSTYLFTEKSYRQFRLLFEVKQTVSPRHSTMHSAVAALGQQIEDAGENPFGFKGPLLMFCHDWGIWDAHRRNRIEPAGQQGPLQVDAERVGEWNLVEFLVHGNRIQGAVNGQKIFDFTDDPAMLQSSPIGLQLHSNAQPQEFRFRHLYLSENPGDRLVTPLPQPAAPEASDAPQETSQRN